MADRFRTELNWEDLRFFSALARHGTLSAAARALSVNHATVARRIASLEAALARKLFERRPDGYALTPAGRAALDAAGQMESAAHSLKNAVPDAVLTGLVRLTATPSLAEAYLISRIAAWRVQHPALEIEIVSDVAARSLIRRATDIALRLSRPDDADLIARLLVTVAYGFFGTQSWRERIEAGETAEFIGFDESNAQIPEAAWLAHNFPGHRLTFRANSHLSQASAARTGCGIALLPHFLAAGDPALVPIALPKVPPSRGLWMLTRSDARRMPQVKAVMEYLEDVFRKERRIFTGG
ncbi:MAG: LysR family transcriptional regulator [Rhodomicrobium sp.]